jgi:DNA-binding LacI/PurR family transcriptional regulator
MQELQRSRNRKRGPSIQDVARLAGVSAQTVSRVSTGAERVRPETRQRVVDAMDKLGYTPNHAARALRNGKFRTIGLITQQFERTGETLTVAAVTRALESKGYGISLLQVQHPETAELQDASRRLLHQAIDGLIVVRAGNAAEGSLSLPRDLPVAVTDSRLAGNFPSIVSDQVSGTQAAINHLLQLGHSTVHHIAGDVDSHPAAARKNTWQRHLEQAGIKPPKAWKGDWTARSGYQIGQEIARNPSITAVYCANDEMAFGLMRALHEHGRRVPEDVSVIGFDNIALSEYSAPPLTTVKQDFERIGAELVKMVISQISTGSVQTMSQVVVPTELIIRGTTAPPL